MAHEKRARDPGPTCPSDAPIAVSDDGTVVALVDRARLVDVVRNTTVADFPQAFFGGFSPDARRMFLLYEPAGRFVLVDVASGGQLGLVQIDPNEYIGEHLFSRDGATFCVGTDVAVHVFDAANGRRKSTIEREDASLVAVSADGSRALLMLSGSSGDAIFPAAAGAALVDLDTGARLREWAFAKDPGASHLGHSALGLSLDGGTVYRLTPTALWAFDAVTGEGRAISGAVAALTATTMLRMLSPSHALIHGALLDLQTGVLSSSDCVAESVSGSYRVYRWGTEPVQHVAVAKVDADVLVSQTAFDSPDAFDLIHSNHTVVSVLIAEGYPSEAIPLEARLSSAVGHYDGEVKNGGVPQFVFNSRWNRRTVALVSRGLRAMGATRHLDLFLACARVIDALDREELARFLGSSLDEYASQPVVRALREASKDFYDLADLTTLNAEYLRGLPQLRALPMDELQRALEARVGRSIRW